MGDDESANRTPAGSVVTLVAFGGSVELQVPANPGEVTYFFLRCEHGSVRRYAIKNRGTRVSGSTRFEVSQVDGEGPSCFLLDGPILIEDSERTPRRRRSGRES